MKTLLRAILLAAVLVTPALAAFDDVGGGPSTGINPGGDEVSAQVDLQGRPMVRIAYPASAFGELLQVTPEPYVQCRFTYELHPTCVTSIAYGSGSVAQGNSMAIVHSGAAANSAGVLRTRLPSPYHPSQGQQGKFTCRFDTPAVGNTQLCGLGDESNGFFFGYDETDFGVMHRNNGALEIQALTITTASSTLEQVTVTLGGNALATCDVTASGVLATTAFEISQCLVGTLGNGWDAQATGAVVSFMYRTTGDVTGTMSLSGATTAVGTFAETLTGAVPTEIWTYKDKAPYWFGGVYLADGACPTAFNPLVANVFAIQYQFLGFGNFGYFIECRDTGAFEIAHINKWTNANTETSLQDPSLPICVASMNTTNTTDILVRSASMAIANEGVLRYVSAPSGSHEAELDVSSNTNIPIITIRNDLIYKGVENHSTVIVTLVTAGVEGTKPGGLALFRNPDLTAANFVQHATNSTVSYDVSATALVLNGGEALPSIGVGKSASVLKDFSEGISRIILAPGETFTIGGHVKGGTSEFGVNVSWVEDR